MRQIEWVAYPFPDWGPLRRKSPCSCALSRTARPRTLFEIPRGTHPRKIRTGCNFPCNRHIIESSIILQTISSKSSHCVAKVELNPVVFEAELCADEVIKVEPFEPDIGFLLAYRLIQVGGVDILRVETAWSETINFERFIENRSKYLCLCDRSRSSWLPCRQTGHFWA